MAQIITNQASIAYEYNGQSASALSNVATATLNDPLRVEKVSLPSVYRAGEEITYAISVENGGAGALSGITVTDDLGSYTVGSATLTPLTYLPPARLLIDGVSVGDITPAVGESSLTFTIPALAAGSRAQILYRAYANGNAPLAVGASITNTAQVSAAGIGAPVSDSATVTAEQYAAVTINKSMMPGTQGSAETLTYTFVINNYGNAPAENIVLRDTFDPAPQSITLQLDGVPQPASDYTYEGGVLTYPADSAARTLSLPAASITQDPATGAVVVTPSTLTVTVVGVL